MISGVNLFTIGAGYVLHNDSADPYLMLLYMWPLVIGQCVLYMCTYMLC